MNLSITPNLTTPNYKANAVKQNASKQQSFGIKIDIAGELKDAMVLDKGLKETFLNFLKKLKELNNNPTSKIPQDPREFYFGSKDVCTDIEKSGVSDFVGGRYFGEKTLRSKEYDPNKPQTMLDAVYFLVDKRISIVKGLNAIPEKLESLKKKGIEIEIKDFNHKNFSGILNETSNAVDTVAGVLEHHKGEGFKVSINNNVSPYIASNENKSFTLVITQNGHDRHTSLNSYHDKVIKPEELEDEIKCLKDRIASEAELEAEIKKDKAAKEALNAEIDTILNPEEVKAVPTKKTFFQSFFWGN